MQFITFSTEYSTYTVVYSTVHTAQYIQHSTFNTVQFFMVAQAAVLGKYYNVVIKYLVNKKKIL